MATLKERTQEALATKRRAVQEAEAALTIVDQLPEAIQQLDGEADTGWYGEKLRLTFWHQFNPNVDLLRVLKMAGVQGLVPKMGYAPEYWNANGEFILDGGKVAVCITGLPKPETCRIEEYTETVTKYRAICNETGEEVK